MKISDPTAELEKPKPGPKAKLVCEACGFTREDFEKTGQLGCPECYQAFSTSLQNVFKETQKGRNHIGKAPKRQMREQANQDKLRDFERDLLRAVENENFEEAAWLRDQIRLLKESLFDI